MTSPSLRPAIWVVIRRLAREGGYISPRRVRDLLVNAPLGALGLIRDYLADLEAASILEPHPDVPGAYRLLRDEGVDTPRVRPDGSRVTQGQGREAMWLTMRILQRPWTVRELVAHASTAAHPIALLEADDYALRLSRAGYLQRTAPGTYRLIPSRYTGPLPPQIRRTKEVFDPNLGRVAPWPAPSRLSVEQPS